MSLSKVSTRAILRAARPRVVPPTFRSCALCRCRSNSSSSTSPLPWFITPPPSLPTSLPTPSSPSSSPIPPAPSHLTPPLLPLHSYLSSSPFLDPTSLTFIHAREIDPDNAWCEWIVLGSMKRGREGGLKGAIEGVKTFLSKSPITFSDTPSPFSPPPSSPLITGLSSPSSRHSKSKEPQSRSEQASGWVMLDSGDVVIHLFTAEARKEWGIEELWKGIEKERLQQEVRSVVAE